MKFAQRCGLAAAALFLPLWVMGQSKEAMRAYADAKPYMNGPLTELVIQVPELKGLRPEMDQQKLPEILSKTGSLIEAQMPRVPNLLAREDVAKEQMQMTGGGSQLQQQMPTQGRRSAVSIPTMNSTQGKLQMVVQSRDQYEYIIKSKPSPDGQVLDESRTAASKGDKEPAPGVVGFSSLWLVLLPAKNDESQFRYLGEQKMNGRQTYVVGFAQIPAKVKSPVSIEMPTGNYPGLLQGIAWIDQQNLRVLKLRTDLLAPLPQIHMDRTSSVLDITEVKIEKLPETLWLPKKVEVTWDVDGKVFGEIHEYSKYHLYQATSRILPD